jgi:Fe2+ transport system protein B
MKVGKKKLAKLEAKAERKAAREAEEKEREERKALELEKDKERKKLEELEEQAEKEKEEQIKREAEEKIRREHEEYLKMKVCLLIVFLFVFSEFVFFILTFSRLLSQWKNKVLMPKKNQLKKTYCRNLLITFAYA